MSKARLSKEFDIAAAWVELEEPDESINKRVIKARLPPLDQGLHQQRKHQSCSPWSEVHMTDGMQDPTDKPMEPEKGVPPKDKPDMGQKPDLKNPEKPEEEIPDKPIPVPDMDPPSQDDQMKIEANKSGYYCF